MVAESSITALLEAHGDGDPEAMGHIFALVYGELRRLARGQRRRVAAQDTLNTTALVNELYLKLAGGAGLVGRHREHFLAVAARALRQLLVDHARSVTRDKRGGGLQRVSLGGLEAAVQLEAERVLALHQAMEQLEAVEPRLVRVTECRHLLGLSEAETAGALGLSVRTVQRDWHAASLWLARTLQAGPPGAPAA